MSTPDRTAEVIDSVAGTNAVERADVALAARAARVSDTPVVRALGALSEVADQPPMFAGSAAVLLLGLAGRDRRLAATGARMLLAVGLATAAKSAIKLVVARTRPYHAIERGGYAAEVLGPHEGPWNSFPSGHTANAVAVAHVVGRAYPEAAMPAWGLAAAVGAIQVPRAAHYPIDVAAGALVGWAAAEAAEAALGTLAARLPHEARARLPL